MLFYFIIFCIIGFILGIFIKNEKIAIGIMITISVCWLFKFGPWAILTFIELFIGYFIACSITTKNS